MSRNYESSGPDVKIRGTAMHIAEKYASLARDAMASGDIVAAENYLQHAEHYNRIILAAQAQNVGAPGLEGQAGINGVGRFNQTESYQRDYDGDLDEGDSEDFVPHQRSFPERTAYNQHQQPQPYIPQNAFPQLQPQPQPQPVVAPALNGPPQPVSAEPYAAPQPDGERMPRRRRRRPMGEHQPKTFAARPAGNGGLAQGASGSPEPGESKPDEAAS